MQNFYALGKYLGASTAVVLMAQPAFAQAVSITGVQLVPTQQGLELVLEVPSGTELDISSSRTGNTFIADIENTQLILPGGKPFEEANPVSGISSVSVIPVRATQVRVTVVSEQEDLVTEVNQTPQGLTFNVATSASSETPTDNSAQAPETAPSETPEASPSEGQESTPGDPDLTETPPVADEEDELEIVVTATRTEEDIANVPRSVTVITREQLDQEALLGNDLSSTLGKTVPGFGPPTASGRTRLQSLRGRGAQILIDGVPQTSNATFNTELSSIDPSAIERIEVVRGPSAVYGDGATGGVINIITRSPAEEGTKTRLGLTLRPNFEHLSENGFGYRIDAGLSAKEGKFDFLVDTAFDAKGATFDGEGDRIPPNGLVNENFTINALIKAGVDLTDTQRLQFSYNFFNNRFDSPFISDPAILAIEGEQKAAALRVGNIDYERSPAQTIHNFNLTYRNQDLLGSELNAQAYYRISQLTQGLSDLRARGLGIVPPFLPLVTQTNLDAVEIGGRVQVDTPITDRLSLLWGGDLSHEENEQFFTNIDPVAFDANRQANVTEELSQSPFYKIRNIGAFAQFTWDVVDQLSLSGGARYENIRLTVDDYTGNPFVGFGFFPPAQVQGGELTVDDVVFNAGAVFKASDEVSIYANFAQGFSLPSVGIALGLAADGSNFADNIELEPQKVNSYELGIRGDFDNITLSLAGFYSTSSLGSTLNVDPTGITSIVRAPQRNYGVEFTADWTPSDKWRLGTIFSWNEGESDLDNDGNFTALSTLAVQPLKATVYVENETLPGWRTRIQALFVGGRSRAFDAEVDPFDVNGYTVVDLFSTVSLGPGKLQFGIQNLFDNQYIPVDSQERSGLQELRRFAGEGRTYSIRYSFEF